MYKICIYNDNAETIIHYPTTDKSAPHLSKMDLAEKDNDVAAFSFSIYSNNAGYNLLTEFKTKIKIIDTRDNSIRFIGRILKIVEKMDTNGFYKEVTAEDAFAYFLDSNVRDLSILSSTLTNALTTLLNRHNASVEDSKKIYLGNVDELSSMVLNCNYETTQAALLNLIKGKDRHYQIREVNGTLYLDCLQNLNSTIVEVRMGKNMKELIKTNDTTNVATRIIPLGANNLTISSVNSGIDYIEDSTAKAAYGVIEKTVSYSDITDATTLKNTALADLSNYTQPNISFEIDALDLSTLSGVTADTFKKGMKIHVINPVMGIDSTFTIVQCETDLTKVYNPKLTIANYLPKIQDVISSAINSSLRTDSVHNGVQVGDDFGIRVDSDKATLTINATEGISMLNKLRNLKVFFVDTDGNLVLDGKQQVTGDNGKTLMSVFKNTQGGEIHLNNANGEAAVSLGINEYAGDNNGLLVLYDASSGAQLANLYADATKGGVLELFPTPFDNSKGVWLYAKPNGSSILIDNQPVATQAWVQQNFQSKIS